MVQKLYLQTREKLLPQYSLLFMNSIFDLKLHPNCNADDIIYISQSPPLQTCLSTRYYHGLLFINKTIRLCCLATANTNQIVTLQLKCWIHTYLGLTFTFILNWSSHVENTTKRAKRQLGYIYHHTRPALYKLTVLLLVDYCSSGAIHTPQEVH